MQVNKKDKGHNKLAGDKFISKVSKSKLAQNKLLIQEATGKVLKDLRGKKSNYILGAEYDISTSLLSNVERGLKDPQLTTIFKLAEAFNLRPSEFVEKIEKFLPKDFTMIEE